MLRTLSREAWHGRPTCRTATGVQLACEASVSSTGSAEVEAGRLHFEVVPPEAAGTPPADSRLALFAHGLLGSGRNLRTLASTLVKRASEGDGPDWLAVLVDLRNHGKSAGLPPPHTLAAAAGDLRLLLRRGALPGGGGGADALVGHSLGGKVVLELLQQLAEAHDAPLPKQVWVLDANPGGTEDGGAAGDDVARVLDVVGSIPLPIASRDWLQAHLQAAGLSLGLRQWLGSSLVPAPGGGLQWTFSVEGAAGMYRSYCASSYWHLLRSPPPGVTINVVRGLRSDRWDGDTLHRLEAAARGSGGGTRVWEVPDAGHWVHADNLPALLGLMLPSLAAV